ncbi:hypothetical protein GUJ93_ZPchr0013g35577 [Zizania palustris]|uniref:Uncharacterized protein n=1 Tax=Zizania palustris TaxID=103762 RepID=A0A8J6C262_ZIZPA|nr:hypothetical protein GUJ93_ZPchr0013g35577 [Zizania palustris]
MAPTMTPDSADDDDLAFDDYGDVPFDLLWDFLLRACRRTISPAYAPSAGRGAPSSPTRSSSPPTRPSTRARSSPPASLSARKAKMTALVRWMSRSWTCPAT